MSGSGVRQRLATAMLPRSPRSSWPVGASSSRGPVPAVKTTRARASPRGGTGGEGQLVIADRPPPRRANGLRPAVDGDGPVAEVDGDSVLFVETRLDQREVGGGLAVEEAR